MNEISRREFLRISTLAAAGVAVVACAKPAEPTAPPAEEKPKEKTEEKAAPTPVPETEAESLEAPMLAEKVTAGSLPPLEERVPADPMTISAGTLMPTDMVDWAPGTFGGTMRFCTARTDVCAELYDANCEQPLQTPGKLIAGSADEVKPCLFKAFEISDDQTSITWYMRKGLKWSDGEPCTTEDVRFQFEDVAFNEVISPTISRDYRSRRLATGEVMDFEVVDDYTFTTTFAEPGLHLISLRSGYSANWHTFMRPFHYMKQFHKDYADPTEFKAMLDEAQLPEAEWNNFYNQKDDGTKTWVNITSQDTEYPRVSAWVLENVGTGVTTWTRNPFYFKVDDTGQQLPYIDQERIEFVSNSEAVTMKILAGEVDWAREYASMVNYPLYKENEAKGGFQVNITQMHVAPLQVAINYTNPDENWRNTVGDVRFRKAINMAIDHQKIVDTVYQGFGTPPTEVLGIEYDPDGANALLDEMGMDQRDADGWRIGLDGNTFVFPLEARQGYTPEQDAVCELLVEYWQDVGIKTDFKNIEATLYNTRSTNNDLFVDIHWAHTSFWRNAPRNSDFLPAEARLWDQWHATQGEEGEEPPDWAKELWEIADAADTFLLSEDEISEKGDRMFEILREQVTTIIPIDNAVYPLIGSTKLGNVPHTGWAIVASFNQEQFYFSE
jgi:peptide/nickel transport system substrate-binding protein